MDSIFYLAVLYLMIIPSLCDDWTASCPWNCTCKWTNGKKSAICNSLEMKRVPTDLSTELQVLVLNDNDISILNCEEFTNLGLLNLQRIYLKKSRIQFIDKDAFRDLKILVEIDLSENHIEKIEHNTFAGNDRLRILYLNGNPIKHLLAEQFPILPHLRSLDLHNCQIFEIDKTAFINLELLEFINIKNNLLENLDGTTFSHMKNLKTLLLDENPWNCDCHLREFRNWYIKSTHFNSGPIQCKQPYSFKNQNWDQINEKYFGCMPTIELYRNYNQTDDIGNNVTYSCYITGDPYPEILWTLNGKPVDNENSLIELKMDENNRTWCNVTIFNVTNLDSGVYTCSARNIIGFTSRNISLILDETVEHVIVEPPKTFLFFRLIVGAFCTVFGLIFMSITVCLCQKHFKKRRSRKNIKGSVSFNDQEKKLLDLSITTNERQDSCEIVNTPSTNKNSESIIALEPVQITIENISRNDEFPLNVGVFPPPPEFCGSNVIQNPAYGNIFISVSVTQDALDNPDLNMYPDLLNIPNRVKGKFLPVNVSSFATLPRNNRSSQSAANKKDGGGGGGGIGATTVTSMANNFLNENLVNYQNLETNFINGVGTIASSIKQQQVPGTSGLTALNPIQTTSGLIECSNKLKMCGACLKNQKLGTYMTGDEFMKCERNFLCPKYDNMGRRVTASGNSTLSLPDEEQMERGIIYEQEMSDIKEIPTPPLPPNGSDFVSL